MRLLETTIRKIEPIDKAIMDKAQARLDDLTKPRGSLGKLEDIAKQVVGITGTLTPAFNRKTIFTMAGDHGVAAEGVSLYPQEVTSQMVLNFINGGAAINVLARHAGVDVVIVDMGVAKEVPGSQSSVASLKMKKIGYGTKKIAKW
ncbi:MAG: nicotinate-nucleotide--dimethylbenzimidazole phosphoribosyltransferase, partial [Candidatus Omnitrophica bacterium]|nr:nicotinate-nucleotide--dimethylbenzimidazole phosphoribosyltransferase [Candidatus Omnitrophota bacterium]